MTIHNNYIFLPKQKKKVQEQHHKDDVIHIEMPRNILFYIKEIFGNPTETDKYLLDFKVSYTYKTANEEYTVIFTVINVSKYTYLDISLNRETIEDAIQSLEDIHNKITASEIEDNYIMIVSYDYISEYYCNEAYPKLNELERNLRRLLLNTYTINFGTEYFETTIKKDLQEKIKKAVQSRTKNPEKRKIEQLKKFFYSMEFGDIQALLFTKNWTIIEENDKEKFLSETKNLSKLTDEELRAAFEKFSPKSDWERLFSDKAADVNIEQLIEAIRLQRNDIAHCKFFYKEKYESFCEISDRLNSAILEAINITEKKDFLKKKAEFFNISMAGISEKFAQLLAVMPESIKLKSSYENTEYILSMFKDKLKAFTVPAYIYKALSELPKNHIPTLLNIETDDEIIEEDEEKNNS